MKFATIVIKVIEILGLLWLISPADSLEVKLNLTGRLADQSSTFASCDGNSCYASRAIDGNYDTNMGSRSCTRTNAIGVGTSWWRVFLGQPFKVQRVVIVNRGDNNGFRMNNFVVGLSNSSANPVRGNYALCGQYPGPAAGGARLSLQCNSSTPAGRYVIVQQSSNGDGYLSICEIEIYAGEMRNLDRWERLSNKRLISTDAIVLSKRSSMMCVGKCQQTVGCDSVNYRQVDNTCEMNFVPHGTNGSHMVIEDGWDNWVQMIEFI